jgi:spore maturation protein CgeB
MVNFRKPQIKGRNFEVPGAGGFLLTPYADNLDEYFLPGKEICVFTTMGDCLEKIRHYLDHDEERESIRRLGHARALRDHTYEKRFVDILRQLGIADAHSFPPRSS